MSILPATGADPVGAAALLGHADPAELARFKALEDAVWGGTSLSPAVIESVRLHSAHLRGCEFCSAVRISAAIEDGLGEAQIALLDTPESRAGLSASQQVALALVDRFLRDPRAPTADEATRIADVLGSRGVVEVLLACAVFATADLRIALGQNRAPAGETIVERARGGAAVRAAAKAWPQLHAPVLDPDARLPEIDAGLAEPVRDLVATLWSGADVAPETVAACVLRSTQLHGIASDEPVMGLLVPSGAAALVDPRQVRHWPEWSPGVARDVLALAEQLWLDPAGVDGRVTDPLAGVMGVDGVIRLTWRLIWVGQLHRLALVLHRGRCAS